MICRTKNFLQPRLIPYSSQVLSLRFSFITTVLLRRMAHFNCSLLHSFLNVFKVVAQSIEHTLSDDFSNIQINNYLGSPHCSTVSP